MQGIVRYVQHASRNIKRYFFSTDIEKDKADFELEKQNAGINHRGKYLQRIDFEVVEITEDREENVKHILPQSERIFYDKSIFAILEDRKTLKKILRSIDWVIEHFPKQEYSYEFSVKCDGNKRNIKALILKNAVIYEAYSFTGAKEPVERTMFGGNSNE